jgi:hypothetical protein
LYYQFGRYLLISYSRPGSATKFAINGKQAEQNSDDYLFRLATAKNKTYTIIAEKIQL